VLQQHFADVLFILLLAKNIKSKDKLLSEDSEFFQIYYDISIQINRIAAS